MSWQDRLMLILILNGVKCRIHFPGNLSGEILKQSVGVWGELREMTRDVLIIDESSQFYSFLSIAFEEKNRTSLVHFRASNVRREDSAL